jgi:hypothetical protein
MADRYEMLGEQRGALRDVLYKICNEMKKK